MLKGLLGAAAGLAAAVVVISMVQYAGTLAYPMPADLRAQGPAAIGKWVAQMPLGAFLIVLGGYAAGSLAGGAVAGRMAGKTWPALAVGLLLTAMGTVNLVVIPHPAWFAAASTAVYLPLAWLGSRLSRKKAK
jgi:hypothetical protein